MMHPDSVFEEQECQGNWWLPSNPDHRVPGTLYGSVTDGFKLELMGSLDPNSWLLSGWKTDSQSAKFDAPEIIWGRTFSGFFTLFNNFRIGGRSSSGGLHKCEYCTTQLAKSGLFLLDSFEELRFRKVSCKFSVLCEWINAKVLSSTFPEQHKGRWGQFDIELSFPKDVVVYENEEYTIKLSFAFCGPGYRMGQNDVKIEWEPQFVIESHGEELSWDAEDDVTYSSIIHILSQFLAVATFGTCYPFDIVGYSDQFEDVSGDGPGKTHRIPIELYREQGCKPSKYDHRKILFPWNYLSEHPKPVFEKWFSFFPNLIGPISLFIDSLSKRSSYSPERFYNLMQALEGLHRAQKPETSGPKVRYALWKRLRDLIGPVGESFDWLIGADGDLEDKTSRKKVIKAMVDARNFIAHCLSDAPSLPAVAYVYYSQLLELLLAMWLMKEIGLPDQLVSDRIQKNFFTQQTREYLVGFLKSG